MEPTTEVRSGQIWADNDWRQHGRTIRVESIRPELGHAVCTVVTKADHGVVDTRGRQAIIALDKFRPTSTGLTSTGYWLASEPESEN